MRAGHACGLWDRFLHHCSLTGPLPVSYALSCWSEHLSQGQAGLQLSPWCENSLQGPPAWQPGGPALETYSLCSLLLKGALTALGWGVQRKGLEAQMRRGLEGEKHLLKSPAPKYHTTSHIGITFASWSRQSLRCLHLGPLQAGHWGGHQEQGLSLQSRGDHCAH